MKRLLTIIVLILTTILSVSAQGSVTATQSADIDAMMNSRKADVKKNNKDRKKVESQTDAVRSSVKSPDTKQLTVPKLNEYKPEIARPDNKTLQPIRTKVEKRLVRRPHVPTWDEIEETRIVTKRVRKGIQKARGFRVQVYSGGNTRIAHQQADQAGQKAKQLFPNQPVYVHFYSPRWMCLVGNFTDYDAARKVMRTLRKEGYPNANVIRMMVNVKVTKPVN